jgi:tetratricopeptide (TPR) repeat protein
LKNLSFKIILVILSSLIIPIVCQAEEPNIPLWVTEPPNLPEHYWGVGQAPIDNNKEEARDLAYQRAVGQLALMAGQTITSSFEDYLSEIKVGKKWKEKSQAIQSVKTMAIHTLRGITIKDFWTNESKKIYYVLVVIEQKEADRQINEEVERLNDKELRELVQKGISRLEVELVRVDEKVTGLETIYGDLLKRLARLEEAAEWGRPIEGLVGFGDRVKELEEAIASGRDPNKVERELTATEWFEKGYNLQREIWGKKKIPELAEVVNYYTRVLELNPNFATAYNNRGVAYYNKGEYDQAIWDFDRALKIKPDLVEAYYGRGTTYADKGEYSWAIRDFDRALKIKPKYAEAYYNRGVIYGNKDKHDRAIWDFDQALKIKPDLVEAYYNRGVAYYNKGEYDRAIWDFDRALKINPDDAEAYWTRGLTYKHKGKLDAADRDFNKACQLGYQGACQELEGK